MSADGWLMSGARDVDILIVDDDDLMRASLTMSLESAGYTVWQAADGKEALKMNDKHHPSIIVTDVLMPKCDGLEILQGIRGRKDRPKVLAISGGGLIKGETCLKLAGAFGADAVLTKPFRPGQLLAAIEGLTVA